MIGCVRLKGNSVTHFDRIMLHADILPVNDLIVDAARLRRIVSETLVGCGASLSDADRQAMIFVEGDLRGHHSHGVRRLPVLVERMRGGLAVSAGGPELTWITDAVLRVDGHRSFGPVAAFAAIDAILQRAESTGIAVATVTNSNHLGMLAPYVEHLAAAGQIGLALTTSEALVHPWGGTRAMIGTNPIGVAVPTTAEPIVLDMSTAQVSMGKILEHAVRRDPIPLGWAVDETGTPTTDPGEAARGAIAPFGGAKGYVLGLAFEAITGVLTRSAFGTAVKGTLDTDNPCTKGDVFLCISVDRLGLGPALPELAAYLEEIRESSAIPGAVTIPGDRARETRRKRLADGIPLHPEVWARVIRLHEEVIHEH
jgi:LDH2 family malate/lactate/ureidoglycolate dehydrogenase